MFASGRGLCECVPRREGLVNECSPREEGFVSVIMMNGSVFIGGVTSRRGIYRDAVVPPFRPV